MKHPHLVVHQLVGGQEYHPHYCLGRGWNISHLTNSIVIGHGVPRRHIPLVNVLHYEVIREPEDNDVENIDDHEVACRLDRGVELAQSMEPVDPGDSEGLAAVQDLVGRARKAQQAINDLGAGPRTGA